MAETTVLKHGDPCPVCGAKLEPAAQATDAQRAAADPRGDHTPLPARFDTATKDQIAEQGPLYRCTRCDYSARLKE